MRATRHGQPSTAADSPIDPPDGDDVVLNRSPVLSVRDLTIGFPQLNKQITRPVDGIDFDVPRGKTVCVVGESGSGKSMTARAIMQLIPKPGRILAGRIELNAGSDRDAPIDIAGLDPKSRTMRDLRGGKIGMIFQEPMSSLGPIHRIGNQVVEAIRIHEPVSREVARERAIELLRQVEIRDPETAIDRYPFEFSGGMRQRAMIAIALACRPRLLIADEPTTALDVTTQAEILDLLRRIQREEGMSLLFITHDMGVVAEIADEVVVMQNGKIREQGDVHSLFAEPRDPYTRLLLDTAKRLEGLEASVAGSAAAPAPIAPVLSVRDLVVEFGGTKPWFGKPVPRLRAVDKVSFDLSKREALGIVGESGSGKTTLARAVLQVVKCAGGQMRFRRNDGSEVDLASLSHRQMKPILREIRMVFQDPFASLNPRMTVGDIVAEPLVVAGELNKSDIRDRVADLLRRVELSPDMMSRYPHAFSGGQRQRISIARALAPEPRLVIADEATAALDVSLRAQMLDLLNELRGQLGLSFLFIGHDIGVVRYFCDRIGVMYRGKLVEIGDADQVCSTPKHAYTAALLSAIPRPDPTARSLSKRHRFVGEQNVLAEA